VCSCAIRSLKRCSFEQELRLRDSAWQGGVVGATVVADTVVTTPISAAKMGEILFATVATTPPAKCLNVTRRLFWSSRRVGLNSLILFLGEFKKTQGPRNENQLLVNFCTAQSH
jgi:hypothetical protein